MQERRLRAPGRTQSPGWGWASEVGRVPLLLSQGRLWFEIETMYRLRVGHSQLLLLPSEGRPRRRLGQLPKCGQGAQGRRAWPAWGWGMRLLSPEA